MLKNKNLGNISDEIECPTCVTIAGDVVSGMKFSDTDELTLAMKNTMKRYFDCVKIISHSEIGKKEKHYLCGEWSAAVILTGFDMMNYIAIKSGALRPNKRRISILRKRYLYK